MFQLRHVQSFNMHNRLVFGCNDDFSTASPIDESDYYRSNRWPKSCIANGLNDFQCASGRHWNTRPHFAHLVFESMLIEQIKERTEAASK